MIIHGTMPELINFFKREDDSLSNEEAGLVSYFFIKKQYDLTSENAEVDIDLDAQWFLSDIQGTAKVPTGKFKYSIRLEDLYVGMFKIMAKAVISKILIDGKIDMTIVPKIGWDLIQLLRKVIYKIKDDERCVYMYICQNEGVSEEKIICHFSNKCKYSINKNLCGNCKNRHSSQPDCNMTEGEIKDVLTKLSDLHVIKMIEQQKYICVF